MGFVTDTLFNEKDNSFLMADGLTTPMFKNGTQVKLFKVGNRYYLEIEVRDNLYFDKIDNLEVKSGSKSMFQKAIKQHQKNKHTAFFVMEVFKNYVATLKDDGITSFVFNNAESTFSKQEIKEIKKIANCFYQTINVPKTNK
jgi:formylmethanofuran dehydrogenase subunit D